MLLLEPKNRPRKLPTDRKRNRGGFVETRTGAYYGKLGYLAGLGRPANRIAEEMGDGISEGYVRVLLQRWGVGPGSGEAWCQVPLTNLQRTWLNYRATKEGISPEEWLRRKIVELL
ncbi:hypothetical protein [Devosia sp. 1635]|uniref:hypothetical protein n=1 Tax=Devosia sp. 1635 TaxID=2726066 RepID=UPI001567462B|nr:hypothetical protein [Devosia sp. 1635]